MSNHDDRVTQLSTVNVDLGSGEGTQVATLAEATIGPDGQIILTGEDGTQSSKCHKQAPTIYGIWLMNCFMPQVTGHLQGRNH